MKLKKILHNDPIIRQVLLLSIIGSVGFILNLFINSYLLKLSDSYTQETNNQLAKKELGILLNNKITEIKSNVKDLVNHQDSRQTYFINNSIENTIHEIENILIVLSKGGFVIHKLPVNFYQNDILNDTIFYKSDPNKQFNINLIDISPKIVEIRRISRELSSNKLLLFENPQDDNIRIKITTLQKEIDTYMQRAFENCNRIFYDTQMEYQAIKKKKKQSFDRINRLKIIWMLIITTSTLVLLTFIFRRIIHLVESKNEDQEKLVKTKSSIEKILNAIPVGFIIFDKNYKAIKVNKEAVYLFGANHEKAIMNKSCMDLFCDQDHEICPLNTRSNKPINNELKIKTLLGHQKNILKNATIIELDGENVVLETFVDITKRKEIEENLKLAKEAAELATQEKSKFLASMSHEIRTPLNGIIGMLSMLQNTSLNTKQKGFLEVIQVSSNNLVSIITDILDFSKIEAGEIQLDYHHFNITKELMHNLKALSLKAEEKGIDLSLHQLNEIPEYLIGDSVRIKQVFINLVSNAIKFTEKGFVKVLIEFDSYHHIVKVHVKDSGIGIPQDRLDKIFSAFSQSDSSITRKFGGTGLGLTISKELIELMGGQIYVSSQYQKGSTFSFEIPAKIGSKPLLEDKDTPSLIPEKLKVNILLAEDNLINQKVAKAIFQKLGYQIDIAPNGQKAIEMYQSKFYDVIFMDIQMPVLDGISATKEIVKIAKSKKQPVFITAMTANALKEDKRNCLQAGMQYFLSKPYKPENIEEALQEYIRINKKI